jgi:hypothetical protein
MRYDHNKDILIALAIIIIILVLFISSFIHDIRRLHRNGLLIYSRHSMQKKA